MLRRSVVQFCSAPLVHFPSALDSRPSRWRCPGCPWEVTIPFSALGMTAEELRTAGFVEWALGGPGFPPCRRGHQGSWRASKLFGVVHLECFHYSPGQRESRCGDKTALGPPRGFLRPGSDANPPGSTLALVVVGVFEAGPGGASVNELVEATKLTSGQVQGVLRRSIMGQRPKLRSELVPKLPWGVECRYYLTETGLGYVTWAVEHFEFVKYEGCANFWERVYSNQKSSMLH